MAAKESSRVKSLWDVYPKAIEGPKTPYAPPVGTNPVLRGIALVAAGWAAASIAPLAGLLWNNTGLGTLRKIKELNDYEPLYDPTIPPVDVEVNADQDSNNPVDPSYTGSKGLRNPNTNVGAYHAAYKAGRVTPTKVAESILDLVDSEAKHKVAFLSRDRERVLNAAEASTRRYRNGGVKGVLDGVPVAVKDEVDLQNHPKTLGSSQDFTDPQNTTSWCVQKWEEAGAIIIGKLNMHELGLDTTGNNPVSGTPTNPHNAHYYPGGSSSASGTTVASNLLPLTLGCDGGGSIRIPSAYCGIYGLKPTHGRVSRTPTKSIGFSTSVAGPMAGCMADLEIGYRIMATPNPDDNVSMKFRSQSDRGGAGRGSSREQQKTIGVCRPWLDAADPPVQNVIHDALAHYQASGYNVIDIDLPFLHEGQLAHAITILTEIGTGVPDRHSVSPANKILLAVGAQTPAHDFLLAQKMRRLLVCHLAFLFGQHPGLVIVTPTTPNAGWHIACPSEMTYGISDADMSVRSMTYVWMANFTGCPAISVPVGKVEGRNKGAGRVPVGMMAMGEWGEEEGLLEWGRVGEQLAWSGDGTGRNRMERAEDWVDVLEMAKKR